VAHVVRQQQSQSPLVLPDAVLLLARTSSDARRRAYASWLPGNRTGELFPAGCNAEVAFVPEGIHTQRRE
jgi:hypothetical protein